MVKLTLKNSLRKEFGNPKRISVKILKKLLQLRSKLFTFISPEYEPKTLLTEKKHTTENRPDD